MTSSFTEDTSISLPGTAYGSVAWADYNSDGTSDLILAGSDSSYNPITKLYKNTGNGFTEDTSISLPSISSGSVAWADYNSDGKPDLFLGGRDSSSKRITKLYKNTGSGFIEDASISLSGVSGHWVASADYNSDGKLDLLVTGSDSSYNPITKLYKNTGNGLIEDTSISFPGISGHWVAWADYNSDGKPDLLLKGFDSSNNAITKLYKNTGSSFIEDTSISFPGIAWSSVAWVDYNSDGKPDLLVGGGFDSSYNPITKLYKNTGNGFIDDTSISFLGISGHLVASADYNSDGKPDLLLTGSDSSYNPITKLYKNTGSGFIEDTSISFPDISWDSVAWVDYNNDGKLDLLLKGWDSLESYITKLYKNTTTNSDTTSPIASSFTPSHNSNVVAVDANLVINFSEAIKKGIGNIVIKKLSDNSVVEILDVTATDVILNGSQLTINPTQDLEPDTDYSVEIAKGAIEDKAGNPFIGMTGNSNWQFKTASLDTTPPVDISFTPSDNAIAVAVGANLVVNFNEGIQKGVGNIVIKKLSDNSVVETLDVTASEITASGGQLTINPTQDLEPGTNYYVEIDTGAITDLAKNNYSGINGNSTWNFQTNSFLEDTSVSLPGVTGGSVAWADYTGDGKPDLLLTGWDNSNNRITKLYKNTGNDLIEDTSISLPGVAGGSVAWADYTGDSKPDLLLTGWDNSNNRITKLYKNTGNDLIEDTSISLPDVAGGSVGWADYNSDGKPDLLLTGSDSSNNT
ncbi:MAG: FG-GAP-like repeat-containing protein, partial [Planktothrix sp.]|uniref:FG-GAP-like repeat-containing protein n=1 Tax=Planktothrix sp. TaxID=3088171 RepID=UPI0038D428F2